MERKNNNIIKKPQQTLYHLIITLFTNVFIKKLTQNFVFHHFQQRGLGVLKNRLRDLTDTKTYEVRTLQSCFA